MAENDPIEENEEDIQPVPIEERWAQDDMAGVVIYDSVEDYKKKQPVKKRSPKIKRNKPNVDDRVIRIKNA